MYPFLQMCCYRKIAKIIYEKLKKENIEISCCNCIQLINDKFDLLCQQDTTSIENSFSFLQNKTNESKLIINRLVLDNFCQDKNQIFHECESKHHVTNKISTSKNRYLLELDKTLENKRKLREINIMVKAIGIVFRRSEEWEKEKRLLCEQFPCINMLHNNCKGVHRRMIEMQDYSISTLYQLLIQLFAIVQ